VNALASAVRAEMLSLDEAVSLSAADSIFYCHYFFPNTVRQGSPFFHRLMWNALESPHKRFLNFKVYRGGAKTTLARLFMSKRVSHGISRTILFISKSEEHAALSVGWLMSQIEYNKEWAAVYKLEKGKKWTQTDCEIYHRGFGHTVRVKALGISGSVRGINIDDYRPDLIIVDDPCDDENAATPEQREKMARLFLGAIKESLVPASEDATAKLVLLQTPLYPEDLTAMCSLSPEFATLAFGCLTDEDFELAESSWPQRWSKDELLAEHAAAIAINQASVWWREKMCKITSRETSSFKSDWLLENLWTVLPPMARYVIGIDPAPVRTDEARAKDAQTDLQAVMVKAYWRNHRYIVEYTTARDEDPDMVSRSIDRFARKYPVIRCGVEDVAYQRTLKWFLEREMKAGRCRSLHVMEIPTKQMSKDKYTRILQAHSGPGSQGLIHCHATHLDFIQQWTDYPNVKFKDLLDVSAICDATLSPRSMGLNIDVPDFVEVDESEIPSLEYARGAP
jgi:hypothetical protein